MGSQDDLHRDLRSGMRRELRGDAQALETEAGRGMWEGKRAGETARERV